MKCPYRKITTSVQYHSADIKKPHKETEEFAECYKDECAAYHDGGCLKVKMMVDLTQKVVRE